MNDALFSNYRSMYTAKETPIHECRNRCLFITDVNINRLHRLMVLYRGKIIKNKDINNLGTNTLYTILFQQLST